MDDDIKGGEGVFFFLIFGEQLVDELEGRREQKEVRGDDDVTGGASYRRRRRDRQFIPAGHVLLPHTSKCRRSCWTLAYHPLS